MPINTATTNRGKSDVEIIVRNRTVTERPEPQHRNTTVTERPLPPQHHRNRETSSTVAPQQRDLFQRSTAAEGPLPSWHRSRETSSTVAPRQRDLVHRGTAAKRPRPPWHRSRETSSTVAPQQRDLYHRGTAAERPLPAQHRGTVFRKTCLVPSNPFLPKLLHSLRSTGTIPPILVTAVPI
ncbi:hypothetical protein BV898_00891 [Hypsibius exemplaris]|uniref:Uncharacterized protein n=1 Tax=Hypsibius exemplaris TaxID=2072580 RepID=A0A1W0XCI1_HYPEX|nr:hypothetical protein BV898_00891 [Hypsibius exemplaris]